jgi:hypothetical protein
VQISLRDGQPHGRPIVVAAKDQGAAGGQQDQVGVGVMRLRTRLSEAGDRNVNQRRIDRGEIFICELMVRHEARYERFDQKVRALSHSAQQIAPVRLLQIESDRPLVAAVGPPQQRMFGIAHILRERPESPRGRAARRLNGDYVGAQIAQDLTAQKSTLVGEVQYPARFKDRHRHATRLGR